MGHLETLPNPLSCLTSETFYSFNSFLLCLFFFLFVFLVMFKPSSNYLSPGTYCFSPCPTPPTHSKIISFMFPVIQAQFAWVILFLSTEHPEEDESGSDVGWGPSPRLTSLMDRLWRSTNLQKILCGIFTISQHNFKNASHLFSTSSE